MAMISENQDGKTELASQPTDWGFVTGKNSVGSSQRKRMNCSALNFTNNALPTKHLQGESRLYPQT
jgi:hypothetical protein